MPAGFQAFDGAGNLYMDVGDRVSRMLGSVYTYGMDGALGIAGDNTGEFFFVVMPQSSNEAAAPVVWISAGVLYWSYSRNGPAGYDNLSCLIHYGVR